MKTVLCSRTRPSQIGEEIYDGGFGYTLDFSWAKMAERPGGCPYSQWLF